MRKQARKARAMAAFNTLAERDKNIVLAIAEELAGRCRVSNAKPPEISRTDIGKSWGKMNYR
ncbi:MAG: hypothetical protein Pg6C_14250 [Treponemataceae bacterium]|nr:MAG: hypothetical protein Pg6C_14250 [Treponemataceae bacterium]